MSLFYATVAVVCAIQAGEPVQEERCNAYVQDVATTVADQSSQLRDKSNEFAQAFNAPENEGPLTDWLNKYGIGETLEQITSVDIEPETIQAKDMP